MKKLMKGRAVLFLVLAGATSTGCRRAQNELNRQVASDQIEHYDFLAKNNGSPMDLCVQAGIIVATYEQADDAEGFKTWKSKRSKDCARAGVPIQ